MFKSKLIAAGIHGFISAFIAVVVAALVFWVWFPNGLSTFTKGADLFLLVLGVELCLGPLMSLVIYNSNKPKTELVRDYTIVGIIQIAALIYGIYSVAQSRPVYLVFVKDRIEVITTVDLDAEDLSQAKAPFNRLTWLGPKLICVEHPTDPVEKSDLLMSSIEGKDIQMLPKYYRECKAEEVLEKAYSKAEAKAIKNVDHALIEQSVPDSYSWLPVVGRFGNWVVAFPDGDVAQRVYINDDPYFEGSASEK